MPAVQSGSNLSQQGIGQCREACRNPVEDIIEACSSPAELEIAGRFIAPGGVQGIGQAVQDDAGSATDKKPE
jgi:hypothetical protein